MSACEIAYREDSCSCTYDPNLSESFLNQLSFECSGERGSLENLQCMERRMKCDTISTSLSATLPIVGPASEFGPGLSAFNEYIDFPILVGGLVVSFLLSKILW